VLIDQSLLRYVHIAAHVVVYCTTQLLMPSPVLEGMLTVHDLSVV
jgi:hypothetical protein